MSHTKDIVSGWVELSGLPKFTTTMLPFLLGAVVAWASGHPVDYVVLAISLLAVFLLTDFCFVLNVCSVYADLKQKGIDFGLVDGTSTLHSTAVSGRFNAFVKGRISVKQAVTGAYLCALAAVPLGVLLHFYFKTGSLSLPLGLLGIFIAYAYSSGLRLSYHGLGELALTAGVGWLTVFSGYYLQAHQVSWLPTIVALPWVIDVFKLKLTRELPDFACDLAIKRRNLAIRWGKNTTARLYLPLTACSWLAFVPLLFLNIPYRAFVLLAVPMFFTAKSLISMHRGDWKTREGLRAITKNAFTGMIMIPATLIVIFALKLLF
jgi:1,4-dihydroxy-2-naphthoate octaprenyltransferase